MKATSKTLYLFLLGLGAFASTILAQSPGAFTATGSMTTARGGHSATLLTNGKVLIAGGAQWSSTASVPLASAELYDLSTGSFTTTGSMTTARSGHRATLLPNGKVLITGGGSGVSNTGTLDSAEVYDPSTGAFTATGKMTTARHFHTATLLNSGKVLIAGGSRALGSAELYDLSTGTFAATGSMTQGEWAVTTATLLNNGVVLIAGAGDSDVRTAELYDPATGTFGPAGNGTYGYPVPLTSTLLTNAQVLDTLQNSCDNKTSFPKCSCSDSFLTAIVVALVRGDYE